VRQENARACFEASSRDLFHRGGVREDRQCFEKALPLLGRYQNARRNAVARDLDRFAALLDVPQQLEERVLGLCCSDRAHE
jgi:hypothetical protein